MMAMQQQARKRRRTWALVLAAVLLVPGCAVISLQYEWRTAYDPEQSYAYHFDQPHGRRVPVRLSESGFTLPPLDAPWDSALLPIDISASLLGHWIPPSIEVQVNGETVSTQYFEPGAAGVRLLNLSALSEIAPADLRDVRLEGTYVSWSEQSREMLLFDNDPRRKRVLVIGPHPDDAEWAAFGLYSHNESRVVALTLGDAGRKTFDQIVADDKQHYSLKARLRLWESLVIPQLGGVAPEHATNLGYFDGTLKTMFEHPNVAARPRFIDADSKSRLRRYNGAGDRRQAKRPATWSSLVADLASIFETAQPDVIVAPHPVLDIHPDHAFGAIAVIEAMAAAKLGHTQLYLYVTHVDGTRAFPFGPAGATLGPPPSFDARTPFRGFYSFPLTEETKVLKLFAFDDAHDIGRGPPPIEPTWKDQMRTVRAAVRRLVGSWGDGDPASQYRRAIRDNEEFFVYPASDACALRRVALETMRVADTSSCAG
jgi:LmbE family N-acetylglucosaminyl deacetylase